jgi:hypothetical protein
VVKGLGCQAVGGGLREGGKHVHGCAGFHAIRFPEAIGLLRRPRQILCGIEILNKSETMPKRPSKPAFVTVRDTMHLGAVFGLTTVPSTHTRHILFKFCLLQKMNVKDLNL